MQCKDIPEIPILQLIKDANGKWCNIGSAVTNVPEYACKDVMTAMPAGTCFKLGLAKMNQLLKRGLVDGCGCGCRGDFVLTPVGSAYLELHKLESNVKTFLKPQTQKEPPK